MIMNPHLVNLEQFEAFVRDAWVYCPSDYDREERIRCEERVYEILRERLDPTKLELFTEYCEQASTNDCLDAALSYFKGEIKPK